MAERTFKESFKVAGAELVDAVKKLVREGNVRRVIIRHDARVVAEFPLTAASSGRCSRRCWLPSPRLPPS